MRKTELNSGWDGRRVFAEESMDECNREESTGNQEKQ